MNEKKRKKVLRHDNKRIKDSKYQFNARLLSENMMKNNILDIQVVMACVNIEQL